LVGGALVGGAVAEPGRAVWAWAGLFCLFGLIRLLKPRRAAVAGAAWVVAWFALAFHARPELAEQSVSALIGSVLAVSLFCGLASAVTRAYRFDPLIIALGWMGVELSLAPLNIHLGLVASTQTAGWLFHLVAQTMGYTLVAFVVAWVAAITIAWIEHACVRCDAVARVIPADDWFLAVAPARPLRSAFDSFRPGSPRAPPPSLRVR